MDYWERLPIVLKRVECLQGSGDNEIMANAARLIRSIIAHEQFDPEREGESIVAIYDSVNGLIESGGSAWYDLNLHLNRFR